MNNNNNNIEQKRKRLSEFISYEEGEKIRKELLQHAQATYKAKYADKYLHFMNDNACTFTINHAQSKNEPFVFTLFSIISQHVMGDCVEECLDKAIEQTECVGWVRR